VVLCLLAAEPDLRVEMAPLAEWLRPSEAARLQSLGTAARRSCFLAGRWLARRALQRWLGIHEMPPLDIAASGACEVSGVEGAFVSISHSAGTVACVAAGVPVGVDVESLVRPRDHLAIAAAVHSEAQQAQLASLLPVDRALPALRWWTQKEAWLKARGLGLDFALMRSLAFAEGVAGDAAVTRLGDLVLAVAVDADKLPQIDGPVGAVWQPSRSTRVN
jgi:4'-phosphopantetheinyl transferase